MYKCFLFDIGTIAGGSTLFVNINGTKNSSYFQYKLQWNSITLTWTTTAITFVRRWVQTVPSIRVGIIKEIIRSTFTVVVQTSFDRCEGCVMLIVVCFFVDFRLCMALIKEMPEMPTVYKECAPTICNA